MLSIACVWNGTKYSADYVEKLRAMVRRNLRTEHRFVCITDRRELPPVLGDMTHVGPCGADTGLPGWWAKMKLLSPDDRDPVDPTIYFDLDTVIVGDLDPLVRAAYEIRGIGICANFTRASGHPTWPCAYGSCIMTFAPGWGAKYARIFHDAMDSIMASCPRGDQQAIERIVHADDVTILQSVLPNGYILGRRDLNETRPDGTSIVVFGGSKRPHNCTIPWVKSEWRY